MTRIFRDTNVAVPVFAALYFAVNVLLPDVSPVTRKWALAQMYPPALNPFATANKSDAAMVVDTDTANPISAAPPMRLFPHWQVTVTRACVPEVTVTAGPAVARSVYVFDAVVWEVSTLLVCGVRAARAFAAVDTRICPAALTSAGPVWFRLSLTFVLCCDAV
jgi:hypothetical protein